MPDSLDCRRWLERGWSWDRRSVRGRSRLRVFRVRVVGIWDRGGSTCWMLWQRSVGWRCLRSMGWGRGRCVELRMRVSVNLIFELTANLYMSTITRRISQKRIHTLTNSKGALPRHTTAPLAPPANILVIATSPAVSWLNSPSCTSTHRFF